MKSSALHKIGGLFVIVIMGSLSTQPLAADEAELTETVAVSEETEEEEINPFEDVAERIDSISDETEPATDIDEKAVRDAFFAILDEGAVNARHGDTVEAIDAFIAAIENGYLSVAPYYNIAVLSEYDEEGARYKGKNLNYGLVFYDRTLKMDESYYPARYNRGVLYHELEMFDEAEAAYRELLGTSGETERNARYNLALLLRDSMQLNEAISVLEGAGEPYSESGSLLLLALLSEESGAASRAIRLYKKALEMDLSFEMNSLAIKKISTLRGY